LSISSAITKKHKDTQGNFKLNSVFDSLSAQINILQDENNELQESENTLTQKVDELESEKKILRKELATKNNKILEQEKFH